MQTAVPILSQVNLFYGDVSPFCHFSHYPFHIFSYHMKDVFLQLIPPPHSSTPGLNALFLSQSMRIVLVPDFAYIVIPHRFDSENGPYTPYCDPVLPTLLLFPWNTLFAFFPASFSRLLQEE